MKRMFLLLILLICMKTGFSSVIIAINDGDWEETGTWDLGVVPSTEDSIVIPSGINVRITSIVDLSENPNPTYLFISGQLSFQTGKKLYLSCGSKIFITSTGSIVPIGGGGSSNLINICSNTVWTAGDGVISGPAYLDENPLPVELLSFTGKLNDSQVDLEWETESELNNDYFTVERSSDGVNFEPIGRINGKGNYNGLSKYYLTDFNPLQWVSYYRLKQTDFDGKFEYSNIISITHSLNTPTNSIMTLYPNPAKNGSDVKLEMTGMPADKEVLVVVTNVLGQQMYSKVILTDNNGRIIYAVDPYNQLPMGTYIIVATSNDKLLSKRLIIQ